MKPMLKPPGTKHLKLKCDILLSTFAFKFNLRHYTEVARVAPKMSGLDLAKTLSGLGSLAEKDMLVNREVFAEVSARVDEWAGGFSEDELRLIAEGRRKFNSSAASSDAGSTPVNRGTAGGAGGTPTPVYRDTAGDAESTPTSVNRGTASDERGTSGHRGTAGDVGGAPTSVYRYTAGDVGTRVRERWISALVGPGRHFSKCPSTLWLTLVTRLSS